MKLTLNSIFLFILFGITMQAQSLVDELNDNYRSFNYNEVIRLSGLIISDSASYSRKDLIDVYSLRAASYYSLTEIDSARKSFIEILRMEKDYQLDPVSFSPKIVSLFNDVKEDFNRIISNSSEIITEEKPEVKIVEKPILDNTLFRNSIIRSIFIPGWGHLYLKNYTKGIFLSSLSAASLGGMIYYIIKTKSAEDDYLKQTEPALIEQKYSDFNSIYKIRSLLIAGYALIWLYSQMDLMFFSDDLFEQNFNYNISVMPSPDNGINFNLQVNF